MTTHPRVYILLAVVPQYVQRAHFGGVQTTHAQKTQILR